MPKQRQIVLNNNVGAFVDILATIGVRSVEMMEDEGAASQGLQVKTLLDGFATTNTFSFGSEPLQIPNVARYPNVGPLLGVPAQSFAGAAVGATKLVSARSNGAAGTTVRFIENE